MGEIVSKTEFARRLDVEPAAVSVWISREKLTAPALTEDNRIDVDAAIEQLRQRLDPARSSTQLDGGDGGRGPSLIAQQRQQRLEEGELRLARLRREELADRGLYLRTDAVRRERSRTFTHFIAAIEAWVTGDLPDRLGLAGEQRTAIRVEWRAFRQRQADAFAEQARALPEFVAEGEEQ